MNNVRFIMQADQRLTKSILNLRHRQNVNTSESLLHLIRIGLSPKHNCTFFTKTQQYSSSASNNVSSRRRVLSKKKKPLLSGPQITAIGCGLFTLAAASLPYYMLQSTKPLHQREDVSISYLPFVFIWFRLYIV